MRQERKAEIKAAMKPINKDVLTPYKIIENSFLFSTILLFLFLV